MHDALLGRIHVKQRYAEFFAVLLQSLNLPGGNRIGDRRAARLGWNVVIDRGDGAPRLANASPGGSQTIEGLRRRDFVHQVQVDIEQGETVGRGTRRRVRPRFSQTECAFPPWFWIVSNLTRERPFFKGRSSDTIFFDTLSVAPFSDEQSAMRFCPFLCVLLVCYQSNLAANSETSKMVGPRTEPRDHNSRGA